MPSNIFANTGTSVSVVFIDKSNQTGDIMLIDASNLGEKVKEGKNQKTVLREDEVSKIENTFINQEAINDFSVKVTYDMVAEKNYSFSAGQYFEVKVEYISISKDEFNEKMGSYKDSLDKKFIENASLNKKIAEQIGGLFYEV